MGIYDRDYYRIQPTGGRMGQVNVWSVTAWLLAINIAVFILDEFFAAAGRQQLRDKGIVNPPDHHVFWDWGAFTIAYAIYKIQIWRALTSQFLHDGLWHILANMVGLWLFGPIVENALGGRRYLFFYLLCGIAGPIMYTALWGVGALTPGAPEMLAVKMHTQLLGASAAIFGIMLAAAYLAPNRRIDLYVAELPLKYFAWIMMAIALYTILAHGRHAGGQAAHLGGGLFGYFIIRHEPLLNVVAKRPRRSKSGHPTIGSSGD